MATWRRTGERFRLGDDLVWLAGFLGDPEAEAPAHLPEEAARLAWREGRRAGVDAAG